MLHIEGLLKVEGEGGKEGLGFGFLGFGVGSLGFQFFRVFQMVFLRVFREVFRGVFRGFSDLSWNWVSQCAGKISDEKITELLSPKKWWNSGRLLKAVCRMRRSQRRPTSNRRCISTIPWKALQILNSKVESYK